MDRWVCLGLGLRRVGVHLGRDVAMKRPSAADCTGKDECQCQGCWYLRGFSDEDLAEE